MHNLQFTIYFFFSLSRILNNHKILPKLLREYVHIHIHVHPHHSHLSQASPLGGRFRIQRPQNGLFQRAHLLHARVDAGHEVNDIA